MTCHPKMGDPRDWGSRHEDPNLSILHLLRREQLRAEAQHKTTEDSKRTPAEHRHECQPNGSPRGFRLGQPAFGQHTNAEKHGNPVCKSLRDGSVRMGGNRLRRMLAHGWEQWVSMLISSVQNEGGCFTRFLFLISVP